MITLKPVVYRHQLRQDGTYPVKIRVTFKRKSRNLPTTLSVTPSELTRTLHFKHGTAEQRAEELILKFRQIIAGLNPLTLENSTVDDVVAFIRASFRTDNFRLDFVQFVLERATSLKPSTANVHCCAIRSFARYFGRESIDVNEITSTMVRDFAQNARAGRAYALRLATDYDAAKAKFNDEDAGVIVISRSPFRKAGIKGEMNIGQEPLTKDILQRMIEDKRCSQYERRALDYFLISFGLMGTNMADLYELRDLPQDVITYHRRKVRDRRPDKAVMQVKIEPCIRRIIERNLYLGRLSITKLTTHGHATQSANTALHKWQKKNGLPPFTMYAARKSWATLARSKEAGIPDHVIDMCLGHRTNALLEVYARKDWRVLWEANMKVLSLLKWE